MSLSAWLENGWLLEHVSSPQEISHLLDLVGRDLADCRSAGLSRDWRFNIAYNAALQCAKTALAASGYRAAKGSHHYRAIRSLEFTIGADRKTLWSLDAFRKKRNVSEYNHAGSITDKELDEMIALAGRLRREVERWLRAKHPELMANPG
ncbi:MAG: hypothetical protein FJY79_11765 [Candidatus Aminicenantes bacterium]|nr:hypothetical protein [Candidatus Aminicenantes bacterium]